MVLILFYRSLSHSSNGFQKFLQTNLMGSFFLAQSATVQLKAKKQEEAYYFMSSVKGYYAHRNLDLYGMTAAVLEIVAKTFNPYRKSFSVKVIVW
jgi:NAD(P)-dependent dehydrogenase (short-subunit alcohol dehydrogenase family)